MDPILTHAGALVIGAIVGFLVARNNPKAVAQATSDIATLKADVAGLKRRLEGGSAQKSPTT